MENGHRGLSAPQAGQPDWSWRRRKIINFCFSDKMMIGVKIVQPVTRRPLGVQKD
jgi:hypothetical protein